jgi:anti-sigma B factor antagonist
MADSTADNHPGSRFGASGFKCVLRHLDGGASLLVLDGELDLATINIFRTHLEEAIRGDGGIVVDLANLRYLDSASINVLLDAHSRLLPKHRRIALVGASFMIRRILGVLRVEKLMPMYATLQEALAYVGDNTPADNLPEAGS